MPQLLLSPTMPQLLHAEPARFRDAAGAQHDYSVFYKDEGGKHHYVELDLHLSRAEQEVSVGAMLVCQGSARPGQARRAPCPSGAPTASDMVPPSLFQLVLCTTLASYDDAAGADGSDGTGRTDGTDGTNGTDGTDGTDGAHPHLLNAKAGGVGAWRAWQNVQTFCAAPACRLVRLSCKFKCCTTSLRCKCGGNTTFRIVVHTDRKRTALTGPIVVKSKRKIPAKLRDMSEADIQAFKARRRLQVKQGGDAPLAVHIPPADATGSVGQATARRAQKRPAARAQTGAKRVRRPQPVKRVKPVKPVKRVKRTKSSSRSPPSAPQSPHSAAHDRAHADLVRENEALIARVDRLVAQVGQLQREKIMMQEYTRAQLTTYRDNYEVILRNMQALTDAHNENVSRTHTMAWDTREVGDALLDVDEWDLPDGGAFKALTHDDFENLLRAW